MMSHHEPAIGSPAYYATCRLSSAERQHFLAWQALQHSWADLLWTPLSPEVRGAKLAWWQQLLQNPQNFPHPAWQHFLAVQPCAQDPQTLSYLGALFEQLITMHEDRVLQTRHQFDAALDLWSQAWNYLGWPTSPPWPGLRIQAYFMLYERSFHQRWLHAWIPESVWMELGLLDRHTVTVTELHRLWFALKPDHFPSTCPDSPALRFYHFYYLALFNQLSRHHILERFTLSPLRMLWYAYRAS